jgi:putative hemolysin
MTAAGVKPRCPGAAPDAAAADGEGGGGAIGGLDARPETGPAGQPAPDMATDMAPDLPLDLPPDTTLDAIFAQALARVGLAVGGRYRARLARLAQDQPQDQAREPATGGADMAAALALRGRVFRPGGAAGADRDGFDAVCRHVLIEEIATGALVGCFRLLPLAGGAEIGRSYSAQFYDLSALADFGGPMVEIGRFCIEPGRSDPDILRLAWAAMTALVDAAGVEMLFGCSSFPGTRAQAHYDAFALLRARHLAPLHLRPRVKAPAVFPFARRLRRAPDPKRAMAKMPPLLRTYLMMGGWVSDHAVIDRDLDTMHVFTGLEIRAVPPARARLLRALAG